MKKVNQAGLQINIFLGLLGLFILCISFLGVINANHLSWLSGSLLLIAIGVIGYGYLKHNIQLNSDINNDIWKSSISSRGILAWATGLLLTTFYVLLYWYPQYLGLNSEGNTGLIALFDPLSMLIKGQPASQWFVYGVLYTLAITAFGIKFINKYRHNKYQVFRTISVIFFQLGFAFLIPEFLLRLNYPYNDFKNMWPLNYYMFEQWNIDSMINSGSLGLFMIILAIAMVLVISPILTYLYGKRWYCSWVCGCGGLAETAGDSFRHLSDSSDRAWKIERWTIYPILVFSVIMTLSVIFSYIGNADLNYWISKNLLSMFLLSIILMFWFIYFRKNELLEVIPDIGRKVALAVSVIIFLALVYSFISGNSKIFFIDSYKLRSTYGFLVGAAFSGVIGVGFYPLLGSRVWCRFGCPMAAILGIQQKLFSRFRITTNGGQCISCGNCTTYCEMGIDVRSYAQEGKNIIRASCVGCGICASVCPRGVLKLENGSNDIFSKHLDLSELIVNTSK